MGSSQLSRGFTPRHVARLNRRVAGMARQIVDDVLDHGECEFVDDVAGAPPSFVIAELPGIPLDDGRRRYELTEVMNTHLAGSATAAVLLCERARVHEALDTGR